jgi:hypothetical protein
MQSQGTDTNSFFPLSQNRAKKRVIQSQEAGTDFFPRSFFDVRQKPSFAV